MSLAVWLGFLLASILIAVTPGPGAVLSMSIGMRQGYRSALMAILGLQVALLVHVLIVAIGFGALLAASELAFGLLKFAGAAYLVWLGIQKWRAPAAVVTEGAPVSQRSLFLQGLLVNLTNPKAIIFVGALLPQFVTPTAPLLPQYVLIAATLCLTDTLVMSTYALAARRLGAWMRDPRLLGLQNRVFGGVFVTAGGALALSSRS
jgi:homoserine/homoserine lactone efflux protein